MIAPASPQTAAFPFTLPRELEAHEPPEVRGTGRDDVRLLVTRAAHAVEHRRFADLPDVLRPGDLLVVNDSRTLPAALLARTSAGDDVTLHLSTHLPADLWIVEVRDVAARAGDALALPAGGIVHVLAQYPRSRRLHIASLELPEPILEYLSRWGKPIKYSYVTGDFPIASYQNVYADVPGSSEMPSAGRPLTESILQRLRARGIGLAKITLHAGVASPERDEPPYDEYVEVCADTLAATEATRRRGGRVIAVGTTVVRALESAVDAHGRAAALRGWTDLVISPDRPVRSVDGLLTGLHEPNSTHVAMLEAIAGRAHVESAYASAIAGHYLWHEFGDSHLLLPA